jgi:transcription elongation GreA/GreB family factor
MGHRPGDLVEWQTPRGARRLRVTQLSRPTD